MPTIKTSFFSGSGRKTGKFILMFLFNVVKINTKQTGDSYEKRIQFSPCCAVKQKRILSLNTVVFPQILENSSCFLVQKSLTDRLSLLNHNGAVGL